MQSAQARARVPRRVCLARRCLVHARRAQPAAAVRCGCLGKDRLGRCASGAAAPSRRGQPCCLRSTETPDVGGPLRINPARAPPPSRTQQRRRLLSRSRRRRLFRRLSRSPRRRQAAPRPAAAASSAFHATSLISTWTRATSSRASASRVCQLVPVSAALWRASQTCACPNHAPPAPAPTRTALPQGGWRACEAAAADHGNASSAPPLGLLPL